MASDRCGFSAAAGLGGVVFSKAIVMISGCKITSSSVKGPEAIPSIETGCGKRFLRAATSGEAVEEAAACSEVRM